MAFQIFVDQSGTMQGALIHIGVCHSVMESSGGLSLVAAAKSSQ